MLSVGSWSIFLSISKMPVEMAQCGKLPSYGTAIHGIRKQLLDEVSDVVALGCCEKTLARSQKVRELADVGCVRRDGQRS